MAKAEKSLKTESVNQPNEKDLVTKEQTSTDQGAVTTPETPKKRKPKVHSQPFFTTTVELKSLQAQRVMNRAFKPLAGSLFRSDVIFRIIKDDKAADALEDAIKELLEPVQKDLSIAIEQAEALIKKQKIKTLPSYTHPRTYKIEIKSPQIAKYTSMVSDLDILMIYLDSLWIMGAIDNKSRQHQTFDWQQRLIKLANRIIHIERIARKQADELGITDQIENVAPKADLDKAEKDIQNNSDDDDDELEGAETQDASAEVA